MVLLGFMIHHMLRVNISIAIIEMVNRNNTTSTTDAPRYNWDEEEKNNVLGYFFWGYVLTQIPGGRLSEIFGTKNNNRYWHLDRQSLNHLDTRRQLHGLLLPHLCQIRTRYRPGITMALDATDGHQVGASHRYVKIFVAPDG
jgi:hypothetical protein